MSFLHSLVEKLPEVSYVTPAAKFLAAGAESVASSVANASLNSVAHAAVDAVKAVPSLAKEQPILAAAAALIVCSTLHARKNFASENFSSAVTTLKCAAGFGDNTQPEQSAKTAWSKMFQNSVVGAYNMVSKNLASFGLLAAASKFSDNKYAFFGCAAAAVLCRSKIISKHALDLNGKAENISKYVTTPVITGIFTVVGPVLTALNIANRDQQKSQGLGGF